MRDEGRSEAYEPEPRSGARRGLKLATGKGRTVSGSAIVQARDRLGEQPLAALFGYTADEWALRCAESDRWRGLALFGVDGTTLRVADTPQNEAAFGRRGRGADHLRWPKAFLAGRGLFSMTEAQAMACQTRMAFSET